MRAPFATVAVVLLAACSGGGGVLVDAGPDAPPVPPDAGPHVCLVPSDFGTPTLAMQTADGVGTDHTMPDALVFDGQLDADTLPDVFQLELTKGYGVFLTNITPGTYALADDDLNYSTCGLCPRVFTDLDGTTPAMQQYYATSGSFTITAIDPSITGTFTDLQLEEVTLTSDGTYKSTPVPNGCTTSITSGSFDIAVTY